MSDSPLETETTGNGTTTFDHFGQSWTVPTQRHAAHKHFMEKRMRSGIGDLDLMIAEAFLSPAVSKHNIQDRDQFATFLEIDPDDDATDKFTDAIAKALGLGNSGNSSPSSASS